MIGVDTNITGCNFTNCSANARGGAICLYGIHDAAYNCVFEDCHANEGGAVCNGTVVNCLFKNNYAKNGGATYYTDA